MKKNKKPLYKLLESTARILEHKNTISKKQKKKKKKNKNKKKKTYFTNFAHVIT